MLSNDVLSIVFSSLHVNDIVKCRLVNKQFKHVIDNKYVWEKLSNKDYPKISQKIKANNDFEKYKMCYDINQFNKKYFIMNYGKTFMYIRSIAAYHNRNGFNLGKRVLDNINHFWSIKSIELNYNRLNALPKWFGQLTNLQSIDLNNNKLTSLPSEFGQLINLQRVDLSSNRLTNLPPNSDN